MADNGTSLTDFSHRLAEWIALQPEVDASAMEVMHGSIPGMTNQEIIGFDLDGVGISLGMNITP